MTTDTDTAEAVRAWAKGSYPLEAGVELLIRTGFAGPGHPWINQGGEVAAGRCWVDVDQINDDTIGVYSGGERRMLRIAASLLGGTPVNLYEDVAGVDRYHLALVLAAIAHAGGSHQHSGGLVPDPNGRYRDSDGVRLSFERLGSLYEWPEN